MTTQTAITARQYTRLMAIKKELENLLNKKTFNWLKDDVPDISDMKLLAAIASLEDTIANDNKNQAEKIIRLYYQDIRELIAYVAEFYLG